MTHLLPRYKLDRLDSYVERKKCGRETFLPAPAAAVQRVKAGGARQDQAVERRPVPEVECPPDRAAVAVRDPAAALALGQGVAYRRAPAVASRPVLEGDSPPVSEAAFQQGRVVA